VEVFESNLVMVLPQFRAQCSLLCAQLALCSCIMMFHAVHTVLLVFVRNDVLCKRNGDTHVRAKLTVTATDILLLFLMFMVYSCYLVNLKCLIFQNNVNFGI